MSGYRLYAIGYRLYMMPRNPYKTDIVCRLVCMSWAKRPYVEIPRKSVSWPRFRLAVPTPPGGSRPPSLRNRGDLKRSGHAKRRPPPHKLLVPFPPPDACFLVLLFAILTIDHPCGLLRSTLSICLGSICTIPCTRVHFRLHLFIPLHLPKVPRCEPTLDL